MLGVQDDRTMEMVVVGGDAVEIQDNKIERRK